MLLGPIHGVGAQKIENLWQQGKVIKDDPTGSRMLKILEEFSRPLGHECLLTRLLSGKQAWESGFLKRNANSQKINFNNEEKNASKK